MSIVEVEGLTRRFGRIIAADGVSFELEEGDSFGLLGPNGAGKTTIINVLTTLIRPTSGRASVSGLDVCEHPDKVRSMVGLVPQELTVDEDLTGMENMLLQAKLYRIPEEEALKRTTKLLSLVDLVDAANRRVETYSGGMRKRLELAEGLIHRPKVLFLDEPTLGLDVQTRTIMWDYIRSFRKEGTTIFLTTHYMEEAEALCEKVAIIDRGRILALDTIARLKEGVGGEVIELELQDGGSELAEAVAQLTMVRQVSFSDGWIRAKVSRWDQALPAIMERMLSKGARVKRVAVTQPTLDEVYLEYTGRRLPQIEVADDVWKKQFSIRRMRS